ncbi:uncharacterized protein LOC143026977 isoform X2 [Oratosquilla oratoria]|uniref:uncharacterized protein LOC143026977 isoform X2 n=1 Tax=Oratosquilla oratoria TaxID=337810 RepID=UPI003F769B02
MHVFMKVSIILVLFCSSCTCEQSEDLELEVDTALIDSIGTNVKNIFDPSYSNGIDNIINIVKIGLGLAEVVGDIWNQVFKGSEVELNFGSYHPSADRQVLALFEVVTNRLDRLEYGIHGLESSFKQMSQVLPAVVRWEIALDTLEQYMQPIHTLYHRLKIYQERRDEVEDHTLMDFAENIVSHNPDSIQSLMAKIHHMVTPQSIFQLHVPQEKRDDNEEQYTEKLSFRPSIFELLYKVTKVYDHCEMHQSPQQLVHGLYSMIALTEAQGYAMLNFAWILLRIYNEGNFTMEQQLSKDLYLKYSQDILQESKTTITKLENSFMRCDPPKHAEGETYIQVTELLQGYIENEVDMNEGGSCQNKCSFYEHTKSYGCYRGDVQYCGQQPSCEGNIHECSFIDSDFWVCPSVSRERRYDWVKYENQVVLGRTNDCKNKKTKVDSWWRWFVHCSYCFCLCDGNSSPNTDRYFSLLPVISNTKENRVVTGIKFTKYNRVIHMQIQEGQTMPQGQVNSSTLQWSPVKPISIISTEYHEGEHYKKLSYEERGIDLDRLVAPSNHVITGVRFQMLGSHLNLEVQITPVDFSTGELNPYKSYWINNHNTPVMAVNPRKCLKLYDPDVPTLSPAKSIIDSQPDSYIQFQPTSRDMDLSQLTVPFLDAQNVAPTPAYWLSGLELYHKGHKGYGGFLGFKVFTYNVTLHYEEPNSKPYL